MERQSPDADPPLALVAYVLTLARLGFEYRVKALELVLVLAMLLRQLLAELAALERTGLRDHGSQAACTLALELFAEERIPPNAVLTLELRPALKLLAADDDGPG